MNHAEKIKPYSEELPKKEQVSNMFDNISHYYDFLNHFLSLGIDHSWRRKAISFLKDAKPQVMLDVATGTADLALEAQRQLSPKQIIGIDISNKMLEIGRKKIEKRQLSDTIQLYTGDSENISFDDNTFDAITVAFGVRNFENLVKGLNDMKRVLKPNGQLVVLEFSKPKMFPFKQLFNMYFKYILPTIGKLTSKDDRAYDYLYESVQAFPDGTEFGKVLEKCGFSAIEMHPLTLGICTAYVCKK